MKALLVLATIALSQSLAGCQTRAEHAALRETLYVGSATIRAEHLKWARQLAATQPALPRLTEEDLKLREEWHQKFEEVVQHDRQRDSTGVLFPETRP